MSFVVAKTELGHVLFSLFCLVNVINFTIVLNYKADDSEEKAYEA